MKPIISPSILSADFGHLLNEVKALEKAGAEWLHCDVMDGHFVPNISFGLPVIQALRGRHHLVQDVHIMISDPLAYASRFVKAGADIVTFHYEALADRAHVQQVIDAIHTSGAKAGLSLKPKTDVSVLTPFMPTLDLILIMSVEPGFGGQSFMPEALAKIRAARALIDASGRPIWLEVDGGINDVTAVSCLAAGADVLVAGSYLFGHPDLHERIARLKGAL